MPTIPQALKELGISLFLFFISAMMVYLPNTDTLLDEWRMGVSFFLAIIALFCLVHTLGNYFD